MSDTEQKAVSLLRMQAQLASGMLEGVLAGLTAEHVHFVPDGVANPIGAQYAHVITGKDGFINGRLKGGAPLFASTWADKTGLSELPPAPATDAPGMPDWSEWARRVQINLPVMQEYAAAVFASVDEYLATLTDADLERTIDLTRMGMGEVPFGKLLTIVLLADTIAHAGEISCLKGVQGMKGYPF
jgi:hypothetical protein